MNVMWSFIAGLLVNVSKAARLFFSAIDSDEEGCGAVKFSVVLCRSVASPELILSCLVCEDCDFFRVDSDMNSCRSDVWVVSV